jgi:hypothetical protein
VDRLLPAEKRAGFRLLAGAASYTAGLAALQRVMLGGVIGVDVLRGGIAALAIAAVLYQRQRAARGRPLAPARVRSAGVALGAAAVLSWFAGAQYGWPGGIHLWDQFHYFMGARYFPELGYDRLYRCAVIADQQLGGPLSLHAGPTGAVDLRAGAPLTTPVLRNLGVDNRLVPVSAALAHPELCLRHFTPARWQSFLRDIAYFRGALGAGGWANVVRDHGYNPPPTWTTLAAPLVRLHGASTGFLQLLALLDVALLAGSFAALARAFGWRTAALGAVFWGTQAFASFYWTGGALLRQDWLFLLVLSVCLARRRHPAAAGAAWALACLLRVFPLLLVAGWVVQAGMRLARGRPPSRASRAFAAGALALVLAVLPLTVAATGRDSWPRFVRHIRLHEGTPVTNWVGLRPLLALRPLPGASPGRMRVLADPSAPDPFQRWKEVRVRREHAARPLLWVLLAGAALLFVAALRRVRTGWVAFCLSQVWLVLLLQLTCYYYAFLLLAAPLARRRRGLELALLGLAALSQLAWAASRYFDDRSLLLSGLAVAFCALLLGGFARWPGGAPRPLPPPAAAASTP